MVILDLFKNWTPEMIEAVKHQGRGCRQRERIDNMTPEEKEAYLVNSFHSPEAKRKSQEATRQIWASKTQEDIDKHVNGTFHTPEAFRKSGETRRVNWANLSDEEKIQRAVEKSIDMREFWISERGIKIREKLGEVISKVWEGKTAEEKQAWLARSCHSVKARGKAGPNISKGLGRYWANITDEERASRLKNWLESGAILNTVRGNRRRPTIPELFLGVWLERLFPGEWAYNGDGSGGVRVGRYVPDFINRNGRGAVIEVFGVYWHQPGDEDGKIEHYRKYGYSCLVLWDYECYDEDEVLGRVKAFGNVKESELPKEKNISEPGIMPKEVISPQ